MHVRSYHRTQAIVPAQPYRRTPPMRLPNTAHTSRPWRIHEFTRDFRLEDV
jgi:hypothetical protein